MILSLPALRVEAQQNLPLSYDEASDSGICPAAFGDFLIAITLKAGDGNEPAVAYNNSFIDEHFVPDSVKVLVNGAVVSAVLDAFCWWGLALPVEQRTLFCKLFAPEMTTFFYLAKSQWPKDALDIWSSLNMVLYGVLMGGIDQPRHQNLPVSVRQGLTSMVYYQVVRFQIEAMTRYVTGINQTHLLTYVMLNGISTGLMTGGLYLWLTVIDAMQYRLMVPLMVMSGATLVSLFFYGLRSSEINFFQLVETVTLTVAIARATAGAIAIAGAGAEAVAVAGAVFGTAARAVAIAEAAARAGAGAVSGVVAEAVVAVAVVAVAGSGVVIVLITGLTTITLSQFSGAFPMPGICRGVIMMIAAGLPLMVASWGVSWQRYIESDVTAHETMQSDFVDFFKLKAFFSDSWMHKLFYWE